MRTMERMNTTTNGAAETYLPAGREAVIGRYDADTSWRFYCNRCAALHCSSKSLPLTAANLSSDTDACDGCWVQFADLVAEADAAHRAQQARWARQAVNPITEDGNALPSGIRGLVRVF
jgi:hypothetical protein